MKTRTAPKTRRIETRTDCSHLIKGRPAMLGVTAFLVEGTADGVPRFEIIDGFRYATEYDLKDVTYAVVSHYRKEWRRHFFVRQESAHGEVTTFKVTDSLV